MREANKRPSGTRTPWPFEGLQPSIGSVGDAYDNAAAETVMGLFKNEAVAKDSPFRSGALKNETDVMGSPDTQMNAFS